MKKFMVNEEEKIWVEHVAIAESLGLELASLRSSSENSSAFQLIANSTRLGYWLGGTDSDEEGTWKWIDDGDTFWTRTSGSVGFTNWNQGQPDNIY